MLRVGRPALEAKQHCIFVSHVSPNGPHPNAACLLEKGRVQVETDVEHLCDGDHGDAASHLGSPCATSGGTGRKEGLNEARPSASASLAGQTPPVGPSV